MSRLMPSRAVPTDAAWMQRALGLASRARGQTSPNPMVGAVVVREHVLVGEGFHRRAGLSHAEPLALSQAGERARGATLYVTLEPCHHTGRTGPCTQAIVEAGIARVVVGASDNDERTLGRGLRYLRAQRIEVKTHVLQGACARLNTAYYFAKATERAFLSALHILAAERHASVVRFRKQFLRTVDAIVVEASQWQAHAEPLMSALARPGRMPVLFVWRDAMACSPHPSHRGGPTVTCVAPSHLKKGEINEATWTLPHAEPWHAFAKQCVAQGLQHVSIVASPSLARVARQEGALCRSLVAARTPSPQRADWMRALDANWSVSATWNNDAQKQCGRVKS